MSLSTWCRAQSRVSRSAKAEDPCSSLQHRPTKTSRQEPAAISASARERSPQQRIELGHTPTVRHRAPDAVHLWMTEESPQGVWGGCRLWGSGGGAVAVASRHGRGGPVGTATACRLVGVRQRAGAGDWRLGYGPVCFFAGGQGPAARRVRPWGMGWCCCPSCRWRGGGDSAERCWSSSWPAGWPVPPLPRRRSSGPGHLGGGLFGGRLRQPVPLSGRPGGRRPPLGPVLLYRFGGVLAGGRAKLCRRRGPAW
jgi:hypothetical protein